MRHGSLLDAIRTLSWPARRRVAGARAGTHASRLRGRAPELSEYRLYRQGDDPKDLDWKLLARSDRPFVRLSDDRAVHDTWFVLDASASMAFPPATQDKWRCACGLTVGLASLAQRGGDPVAVLVPGSHTGAQVAPTTRRDAALVIGQALDSVRLAGAAALAPALARVAPATRLVIMSDLLGDEDALRDAAAAHFAQGGEVIVLHVLSRQELVLDPRLTLVEDPEQPGIVRPVDAAGVAAYAAALSEWLHDTRERWIALGATYLRIEAEGDAATAVRSVIEAVQLARTG